MFLTTCCSAGRPLGRTCSRIVGDGDGAGPGAVAFGGAVGAVGAVGVVVVAGAGGGVVGVGACVVVVAGEVVVWAVLGVVV
jgi:hypothetical protein